MRLLRQLTSTGSGGREYVAAIGGFDGIHLGHRALIARAQQLAAAQSRQSMVLTFEPLPKEYFARAEPPARLTSFRERWRLLAADGPDALAILRFTEQLRSRTAAQFATQLAAGGIRQIVIGHDFRAGYRGEASAQWFVEEGPRFGIAADVVAPVIGEGMRIGSGAIRAALAAGNLPLAARLLGRPYSMRGRVIRGQQLGRTLGYPTANLRLARRAAPFNGIFAVRVRGCSPGADPAPARDAVASLGTRPTVGGTTPLLEVHVFDFAGDLYGRELEVEFVARLRDEERFDSVDAMVEQIHRDAAAARAALTDN
ncbi:MAG: bifunctional riboflavin kinase/FAD synthetase [Steroidobacteraceae bacterium]